jgi:hypothetical protein
VGRTSKAIVALSLQTNIGIANFLHRFSILRDTNLTIYVDICRLAVSFFEIWHFDAQKSSATPVCAISYKTTHYKFTQNLLAKNVQKKWQKVCR